MSIGPKARFLLIRATYLLLALLLLTVFVNLPWFDEDLHPQLQALIKPQAVALQDNAYPLIYGLQGADDKDPFVVGKDIIDRQRELFYAGKQTGLTIEEFQQIQGGTDIDQAWQAGYDSLTCQSQFNQDCPERLLDQVKQNPPSSSRLSLQINRYLNIQRQANFREIDEVDVFLDLPSYGLLMNISRMQMANLLSQNNTDEFIQFIEADLGLWKLMLREGQSLIAKMVSLAGIRNCLQFTSVGVRSEQFTVEQLNRIQGLLVPLSEEERDIGETFLAEMRLNIISQASMDFIYQPSWLTRLFWQRNATNNLYYREILVPIQLKASLSAKAFYQQKAYEQSNLQVRVFPPDLYNLAGKLSLKDAWGGWNVQDYISRVHNLDGRISLLRQQIEFALHPVADIEGALSNSAYRNPYTGEPFHYNGNQRSIGFQCLGSNGKEVCQVLL